jgi:2-polyprenyl-6-methoxyphenol hydroxylase-like FAD-dependent oxidoreductase
MVPWPAMVVGEENKDRPQKTVAVRQDLPRHSSKANAFSIWKPSMKKDGEVLVVGAGPVGLTAALRLRERGVNVTVIDQESRITRHSYACALHPHTLELLDQLGLVTDAVKSGRSLHTLAFYDGTARRAQVDFTDLPIAFPFVLVLPQSTLEGLLEQELARQGIHVRWNHRLANLRSEQGGAVAAIEKLVESMASFFVSTDGPEVQDKSDQCFSFVIGTDGQHSSVRERLQIRYESCGEGEAFVVYEFATDAGLPHEARVVWTKTA